MSATWRIFGLDVWGNETDGFEVNDRFHIATIELGDSPTDNEVWSALVKAFVVKSGKRSAVTFDGDDMSILIDDRETGRPYLQLEREE